MPNYYGVEVNGKALAHSKGPWKNHKYITKEGEGEGAKYTYAAEKTGVSSGRKKNVTGIGSEIGKTGNGLGTGKVGSTSSGSRPYVAEVKTQKPANVSQEYWDEMNYNSQVNTWDNAEIKTYENSIKEATVVEATIKEATIVEATIKEATIVENIITESYTKPVSSLPQSSVNKGQTAVQKVGDFMKTAAKTVVSAVTKAAEKVGSFLGNLFGKKSK